VLARASKKGVPDSTVMSQKPVSPRAGQNGVPHTTSPMSALTVRSRARKTCFGGGKTLQKVLAPARHKRRRQKGKTKFLRKRAKTVCLLWAPCAGREHPARRLARGSVHSLWYPSVPGRWRGRGHRRGCGATLRNQTCSGWGCVFFAPGAAARPPVTCGKF
jgi:hypothetical protein